MLSETQNNFSYAHTGNGRLGRAGKDALLGGQSARACKNTRGVCHGMGCHTDPVLPSPPSCTPLIADPLVHALSVSTHATSAYSHLAPGPPPIACSSTLASTHTAISWGGYLQVLASVMKSKARPARLS